jgi:hypothetical protein
MANRRGKGESEPITLGQTLAEGCRFRPNRREALMRVARSAARPWGRLDPPATRPS